MNNKPAKEYKPNQTLECSFDLAGFKPPAKTEDEGKVCARCGAIAYDPVITQTAKTLTDEEIIKQANHLADGWFSDKFEKGIFITEEKIVDLVRAILKKAQEK